jgi:hypothetical protein
VSLGVFLILFSARGAQAAAITFNFTGTITQDAIQDSNDPFGGSDVSGAVFSGSYTFDSAAANVLSPDPHSASYQMAGVPFGMNVTIAGHSFSTSDFLAVNVQYFPATFDFYGAIGCTGGVANCSATPAAAGVYNTLQLSLVDPSGAALSNDDLPLAPVLLTSFVTIDAFSLNQVTIDSFGNITEQLQLQGNLDTLSAAAPAPVPEPTSLLLLGSGLLSVSARKRLFRR